MMWAQNVHAETIGKWGTVAEDDASPLMAEEVFLPAGAFETTLADDLSPLDPQLSTVLTALPALAAFGFVAAGTWAWWRHTNRRQHRRTRLEMQHRVRLGLWPGPGFAGWSTLRREYGRGRPRKIAKHIRPSLTWSDRWFGDPRQYSVDHGKAHRAWCGFRATVRSSFQDNSLVLGPAQEGKSALAVYYAWDAPGPLVSTTIRADLLEASGGYRSTLGDLHVWNPAGIGHIGSTFRWNIIEGCEDFSVATGRAYTLAYASNSKGLSDAAFWKNQAATALAAYMHAAGLELARRTHEQEHHPRPVTLQTVYEWVTIRELQPYEILRTYRGADENAYNSLLDLFTAPTNTRGSILKTLTEALRFMVDRATVEALTPDPRIPSFDIEAFLRSKDSLYLMSPPADTHAPVAPLLSAFTSELYRAAMLAHSKKKLDPHLTMLLDEVANICPVPLPEWLSYAAGSGVQIHSFGQSWAQFINQWGPESASTIWTNSKFKLLWPTSDDEHTRQALLNLGGRIRIDPKQAGADTEEQRHYEKEADALADPGTQVPNGYAVARLRNKRPTIVRTRVYWKDKRSKLELPQLPPVTRYTPHQLMEVEGQTKRRHLPSASDLHLDEGGQGRGRDPETAPALRPAAKTTATAEPRTRRAFNPAAAARETESLGGSGRE